MVLVERRELIEGVLKEILAILDFEIYDELLEFMDAEQHLKVITKNINRIVKFMRSIMAKKRLNQVRPLLVPSRPLPLPRHDRDSSASTARSC